MSWRARPGIAWMLGALSIACSARQAPLGSQSAAPEYRGSGDIPLASDPKSLAALGSEPAPSSVPTTQPGPPAPPVLTRLPGAPEPLADGTYAFSGAGLELIVDPRRGGNATRFALDGKSVLVAADASPSSYGSAFWLSPRSTGSSPPSALEATAFAAELEGSTLVLTSEPIAPLGIKVVKRYRLDTARRAVEVTYQLRNATDRAVRVAPWEVHRVASNTGLTFFPSARRLYLQSTLRLDVSAPFAWFSHEQYREPRPLEAFADGAEGWLAYAQPGVLFVKVFDDTAESEHAPGEAEIELAADYEPSAKLRRYVSLGQQGPYVELAPGAESVWNSRWFLRRLPASIAVRAGNPELTGFVRGVIF